jgi:3-hydroxyisobutyrate dehydrogenase-like beta-hydroxyacid dehydrogenase
MTAIGVVGLGTMGGQIAGRVRSLGADMLEAPVSGSPRAAEDGSLAIMVGGTPEGFGVVEPLLHQLGHTVRYVGANGQGLLLKLAINLSLGAQMLAFSEGVLLAERGGIEPTLALEVMTHSAIGSPMLQARAPLFLDLPEQAGFDVQLMHKDIRLALAAAGTLAMPLPLAAVTDDLLRMHANSGTDGATSPACSKSSSSSRSGTRRPAHGN